MDEFIFMHPIIGFALACIKVIPPMSALNDAFNGAKADAGMSGGIEWKPFEIDTQEYAELVEILYTDPEKNIVLDEELNNIETFKDWNSKALSRYNPRKRKKS